MATTTKARPEILSGFCGQSEQHSRCPVTLGTRERAVPCACACHRTCPTCGQSTAGQEQRP